MFPGERYTKNVNYFLCLPEHEGSGAFTGDEKEKKSQIQRNLKKNGKRENDVHAIVISTCDNRNMNAPESWYILIFHNFWCGFSRISIKRNPKSLQTCFFLLFFHTKNQMNKIFAFITTMRVYMHDKHCVHSEQWTQNIALLIRVQKENFQSYK